MRAYALRNTTPARSTSCTASSATKSTWNSSPEKPLPDLAPGISKDSHSSARENHLFLKPKATKVSTNLTVLTNRRHYQIDYTASSRTPGAEEDVIYALRFTYPESAAQSAAEVEKQRLNAELENASMQRPRNIDYWYCGEATLRPVAASDDGVHTRLRFSASAELPAIFVRNDDDSESLLNFSMDAGEVVIHRVARQYILRRGKLTGCVVNKGYAGGARLESGTVAPAVERRVQGGVP